MQNIKLRFHVSHILADVLADCLSSLGASGVASVDRTEFEELYLAKKDSAYATDAVDEYLSDLPEFVLVEAWFSPENKLTEIQNDTPILVDLDGDFQGELYEVQDKEPVPLCDVEAFIDKKMAAFQEFFGGGYRYLGAELIESEDWENAWKEFYTPLRLSSRITVCPSWIAYQASPGEEVISLDPGTAFGTGYHESTELCAAYLDELAFREEEFFKQARMLDLGTGSGILAIIMAKLGAKYLEAVDIDGQAVETAKENFSKNDLNFYSEKSADKEEGYFLYPGELSDTRGSFDLLVANLIAKLHVGLAEEYKEALKEEGYLLLSGIIDSKMRDVLTALERVGLVLREARFKNDWWALLFRKPAK